MSEPFRICARGPQTWEQADVEVIDGRVTITVDNDVGSAIALTRIQTSGLLYWLEARIA